MKGTRSEIKRVKDEETGCVRGLTLEGLGNLTREPVLGEAAAAVHPRKGESGKAPGAAQARGARHRRRTSSGWRHWQRAVRRDSDHAARSHTGAAG